LCLREDRVVRRLDSGGAREFGWRGGVWRRMSREDSAGEKQCAEEMR